MTLSRLRWMILGLLFLSTTINYLDRQALSVLLPTLRGELGLTSADYGNITTAFLLAYTITVVPLGMWIDRIGTRIGLAVSVLGWSIIAMLHAVVQGPVSLILLRAGLGATEAGNFPAGTKAIAQWFPPARRASAMALFDCGTAVGAVLAPPLVALLALHHGWRTAFVCTGSLGLLWLVGWLLVYRSPDAHPALSPATRAQVLAEQGSASGPQRAPFGAALRRIIGLRQLWGLMVTRLTLAPVWWLYVFWLPDYLSRSRGFSLKDTAFYAWIPYLTVDLGKIAGGALSDALLARGFSPTVARKGVMIASALAMTCGIMVVGASSAPAAIALASIATFGFGAWSANVLALHADIFPATTMGTATGTTLMASNLSGAAFTFSVGRVVDLFGYSPVFWVAGVLPLCACIPLLFWIGRVERIRES